MTETSVEDAESVRAQREKLPLYAPRVKVHPKRVGGPFRRAKWTVLVVLLVLYYLAPWLRWDRGPGAPDQAFLIDMPSRRAYFLWIEIWPQEVYYLAGLLMIGAFGLFLVTALFGRVWCGYACPQTVWTDLFMWIERLIEGDRNARIKLDAAPMSASKLAKRAGKHTAWLVISLLTGGAWIMYFYDAPQFLHDALHLQVSLATLFFIGLFTATTYLLGGLAREQVCTYMCPWPRFQAAMFDEDSLIVTYQDWRGEPRGRHAKGESWEGRGDCVACNQCVAVCPTGIDIRDGNQLECIGCALCIDACNGVMEKIGRPKWLIAYDSVNRMNARAEGRAPQFRLIRMRTLLYLALLVVVGGAILFSLSTRGTLEMHVLRDRAPLFVTLSSGHVRNGYTLKVLNKTREQRTFLLETAGVPQAGVSVVGLSAEYASVRLTARPDSVETFRVYVEADRAVLAGEATDIVFLLTELNGAARGGTVRYDAVFRGPPK